MKLFREGGRTLNWLPSLFRQIACNLFQMENSHGTLWNIRKSYR